MKILTDSQRSVPHALLLASAACVASAVHLRRNTDVPKESALKNPGSQPIGDTIKAPPAQAWPASHQKVYYPRSPAARRDVSPTDISEYGKSYLYAAADALDDMKSDEGFRLTGATCQNVCMACSIKAATLDRGTCHCYATCLSGACGVSGEDPPVGWSNSDVTSPKALWQASCNRGTMNCEAQCISAEMKAQLKHCRDDSNDISECYNRLDREHKPLPHDARNQRHYCFRQGMEFCDVFSSSPKEGNWRCFDDRKTCQTVIGDVRPATGVNGPSVWLNSQRGTPVTR